MSEIKIKLIAVGNFSSRGIGFDFEGRKSFNKMWYSWENIASKMINQEVEALKDIDIDSRTQLEKLQAENDNLKSDLENERKRADEYFDKYENLLKECDK